MNLQDVQTTQEAPAPATAGEPVLSDAELWTAFRADASQVAREALFLRYLPFARRTAVRTLRLHSITHIELADVYQAACIGLMQAMERFDPTQGAEFTTYAAYRVQGAVMNAVETYSEVQQQIAARGRSRAQRLESLRPQGVLPTSTRESIVEALAAVSMGLAIGFMLEDSNIYADPEAPPRTSESGYQTLAWKQARESLQQQVDALPEGQRKILAYHYFQGLDFERIAVLMGLSKGRVSQIHKQGLAQLRDQLAHSETFTSTA